MRAAPRLLLKYATANFKPSLNQLLFGNGEDGFLFGNFAELDELFTTSTGQTNVAANDDPVGLALDDHGWGGLTLAQIVAAQTNLITNGDFSVDDNWSKGTGWSIGSGVATKAPGSASNLGQGENAVPGAAYYWEMTVTRVAGSVSVAWVGTGNVLGYSITASGTYSGVIVIPVTSVLDTFRVVADASFDGTVDNITLRRIPGNHAAQTSSANCPLWKANAGKPYLMFDGTNDSLIPPFYPMASGTGLTMAAAFNASAGAAANCVIGGGTPTGDKRAMIGLTGVGALTVGWGTEIPETVTVDRRNGNHVLLMTGDASGRDVWFDGMNVTSLFAASVGMPDGTGGALTIGGRQNTVGGGPDRLFTGNISAAMAINRRVTAAETSRIMSEFQRTF